MNNDVITMAKILNSQYKAQLELLKTEREKTDILVKGDVEKLDCLMNTQQAILMNVNNIEKQREALCFSIGIKNFSLKDFADKNDPDNSVGLKTILFNLTDVMFNLKKAGDQNEKLLNVRIQTLQHIRSKLSEKTGSVIEESSLTYNKEVNKH